MFVREHMYVRVFDESVQQDMIEKQHLSNAQLCTHIYTYVNTNTHRLNLSTQPSQQQSMTLL